MTDVEQIDLTQPNHDLNGPISHANNNCTIVITYRFHILNDEVSNAELMNSDTSQPKTFGSNTSDKSQKSFEFFPSLRFNSAIPVQTPINLQSPDSINSTNHSSTI